MKAEDFAQIITDQAPDFAGLPDIFLAVIASVDGATGTYTLTLPGDTSAPTMKFRGIRSAFIETLAVSDLVLCVKVGHSILILGEVGTSLNFTLNAPKWGGIAWATPGATVTLDSANTERSKTGVGMDSYSIVKSFDLSLPGRYRVTAELSRTGGSTTSAKLQLELSDGRLVDCSTEANSTTTNPSFSSHNLDMNVTANAPGTILHVLYKGSLTAQTAYIKNVAVKYTESASAPTLYHGVILD